jgi:ribonucleoside-diphosphate reductase alpha chain
MPDLLEEIKKKVNKPVPDLPLSDDTEMIEAKSINPFGNGGHHGSGSGHGRTVTNLSDAIAHFQQDAPTCPNCGHVAVRNGACYKCLNCGESLGCS